MTEEQNELLEGFQVIRTFVREVECFDMKMFREMGGYSVYAQIANLNFQAKKHQHTLDAKCTWSQDEEGSWDTSCGVNFTLLDETTPKGNSMDYCPYCGCPIVEEFYKDPFADEEVSDAKTQG
jgi:hypothetical protein